MNKTKFKNETFEFSLTLLVYDSENKREYKLVKDLLLSLSYDLSKVNDLLNTAYAFCCGQERDFYIIFDSGSYKEKGVINNINQVKTLSHECNHIKEYILEAIGEYDKNKETECAMRISDWCFKKCLQTKHFKSMFK